MSSSYRVEMEGIYKSFGGIHALENVSIKVAPGEIHAVVGENGAGKSTLMKILSGAYSKNSGVIKIDGESVDIKNPHMGKQLGVGIIYQEFALAPDLTVAENIFISHLNNSSIGIVKWKDLFRKSAELLKTIGFDLNPASLVRDLSVAYQQIVEITKALSSSVKVLILDEPTAVLAPEETKQLFEVLKTLAAKGVSIIYISHRLEEIFEISDKITVLKDGKTIDTVLPSQVSVDDIVNLMIGRSLETFFPERESDIGDVVYSVKGLSSAGAGIKDINLEVKAGEVLGIAGLVGSGRTETVRTLFGAEKKDAGVTVINGREINNRSPREAVKNGIAFVPEDRKKQGAILSMSIRENILLSNNNLSVFGIIQKKREKKKASALIDKLRIKTNSSEDAVTSLSGGNQQKVVLAKWFNTDSKIIILDEPTRGVDVGAKIEIYKLINELAEDGMAVIMISSEMVELIGMCDRIAVMKKGTIKGILEKDNISEKNIMVLAI